MSFAFLRTSRWFSAIRGAFGSGFRPRRFRHETSESRLVTLLSPHDRVRRVEAFATEQSTDLPQLREPISFLQGARIVIGVEPPP
jgi:hypothetical protein